ncbi:hypothetical protein [Desulfofalx alkaliphila]|uniref:hypothetical protein n=1 Tax=Desulfofalx alkaliphila TaxID=105483 RepID=UPI0004E1615A|nr:hypothetical protein [Desulfofalx alkaliphila]
MSNSKNCPDNHFIKVGQADTGIKTTMHKHEVQLDVLKEFNKLHGSQRPTETLQRFLMSRRVEVEVKPGTKMCTGMLDGKKGLSFGRTMGSEGSRMSSFKNMLSKIEPSKTKVIDPKSEWLDKEKNLSKELPSMENRFTNALKAKPGPPLAGETKPEVDWADIICNNTQRKEEK